MDTASYLGYKFGEALFEARRSKRTVPYIEYNWDDPEFKAAEEAMIADWFERHPECIRGTGQFAREYPEVYKALDALVDLCNSGRIHADEYLIIHKALHAF